MELLLDEDVFRNISLKCWKTQIRDFFLTALLVTALLYNFNSLTANIITANRAGKRMKYLKYDALNFLFLRLLNNIHINWIVPENCAPNIENGYSPVDKLKLGVAPVLE